MKTSLIVALVLITLVVGITYRDDIENYLRQSDTQSSANREDEAWNRLDPTAKDLIIEYEMVKSRGGKTDICLRAGAVSEYFLQLHDSNNYNYWRDIEHIDCKKVGLDN